MCFYVYIFFQLYTFTFGIVRTNIVIDDALMEEALKASGAKTKREVVELGLKTLVRLRKQERIRATRGKLNWEGDLEAMRTDS